MNKQIEEIYIGKRIRKELGDLKPLMESLRTFGLMNPIVVNQDGELIAGHRRLEAAKALGWRSIEARVVNVETDIQMLELEIEENLHRRSLAADELADGYNRLDKLKHPSVFRRIWNAIKRFFSMLFGGDGRKKKGNGLTKSRTVPCKMFFGSLFLLNHGKALGIELQK